MRSVRHVAAAAVTLQAALLGLLVATSLAGPGGIAVAAGYGAVCDVLVVRALVLAGRRVGPADLVTWARCALVGVVVALVLDGRPDAAATPVLVLAAGVALLLDGVDGRVARRTGTASAFGARFDMEVDASLVLVLSIGAAPVVGGWVLLVGAARYLLLVAGALVPALTAPTPARFWRKVVAVVQGVVLAVVCSGLLPAPLSTAIAIAAGAALAWSFATQVHGLLRGRSPVAAAVERGADARRA